MHHASPLRLGVNIDHVATVRNARGGFPPDPVRAALLAIKAGADGITAHLREDRRHIRDDDMARLKAELSKPEIAKPLNFEMAATAEMLGIALATKPHAVCLVPERRTEVTTEGGLDVVANEKAIAETCKRMAAAGIEVSLFIAPAIQQIEAAVRTGAGFIELHTGAFAENFHEHVHETPSSCEMQGTSQKKPSECKPSDLPELERLIAGAKHAHGLGLKVNAGHGLNYENLPLLREVPHLVELNIGHSIVSRAVTVGMMEAVREMMGLMEGYR